MDRTEGLIIAAQMRAKALEVEVAGMQAENDAREDRGAVQAYGEEAFMRVADRLNAEAALVERLAEGGHVAG